MVVRNFLSVQQVSKLKNAQYSINYAMKLSPHRYSYFKRDNLEDKSSKHNNAVLRKAFFYRNFCLRPNDAAPRFRVLHETIQCCRIISSSMWATEFLQMELKIFNLLLDCVAKFTFVSLCTRCLQKNPLISIWNTSV